MSVRLFVLGALLEGEAHGYELIEKGRRWGLETWTEISFSSIYHALRTMAAEGLLEERGLEREGGKPERKKYRITPRGRAAFASIMEKSAELPGSAKDSFYLVLAFLPRLGARKRAELLRRRGEVLRGQLEGLGAKLAFLDEHPEGGYWQSASVLLNQRRIEAELEWLGEQDAERG